MILQFTELPGKKLSLALFLEWEIKMNKHLIASVRLPGNHPQLQAKNLREEKLL